MKIKKVLLLLLLALAITVGGIQVFDIINNYFFSEDMFAKSSNLEIQYWVDPNEKEVEDTEEAGSLLAQLRSQKKQKDIETQQNVEDIEEIDNIELESIEKKKSIWVKLLESKEKNKQNLIPEVTEKDKKDDKQEEIQKEEPINSFQEEINKSRENAKKKAEENKKSKTDKAKEGQSLKDKEAARQKAIEQAKKEKEKEKKREKEREKKENIVTMHIRCDTAVAKGMAEDSEWQGIVPPSGVILPPTKFKIEEGDTVLDVLIMAKEQYKFHMSYRGNKSSAYIEGINNLYEFDGGRWSGWMYCVNDWYPNYGAGVYVLKGGDVIEWNYTCNLGKDLGQDWLGN